MRIVISRQEKKPCLQYQIKRCSGPCVGMIENPEYEKSVENAIMFLKVRHHLYLIKWNSDMINASENKNYELAAKFRDNIALVRDITSHYSIFPENQSIDFILSYENNNKLLVDINIIKKWS